MKKILIIALVLNCLIGYGQKEKPRVSTKNHVELYSSSINDLGFGLTLEIDSSTKRIEYTNTIPNQPYNNLIYLEGIKNIKLHAWIKNDSASFYRYSIFIEGKQLVADAIPIASSKLGYGNVSICKLGTYAIENKKLTISYYKVDDRLRTGTVIIYNKPFKPAQLQLVALNTRVGKKSLVGDVKWKDSTTFEINQQTKAMIFGMKSTDLDFVYTAYLIDKSTNEIVYQSANWEYYYFSPAFPYLAIDSKYFNKSGEYELQIVPRLSTSFRYTLFQSKMLKYNFTIKNTDEKLFSSKEIALIAIGICAIFGAIFGASIAYIKKKSKQKINDAQRQKDLSKTQLNSIRAQLNPHFMFNALAGIQNLMHTNKIEEANRYLGKFARLTRNVLDQRELISLAEERNLLEDYLQMEQFRFGFTYQMDIDQNLNLDNIEIPTMLLQPFVENAVKHGIAEMENEGKIIISFLKESQNLMIKVSDNGKGFDASRNYTGLGLQLSKNRISLLNTIYPETSFLLAMKSSEEGSEIKITLTQWL